MQRLENRFLANPSTCDAAQSALADATVSANSADKKKKDMIDKIGVAKDALEHHKNYLTAMQDALTIKASRNGRLIVHVGVGAFVKKGHMLGEIGP
jgi:hypothetical protein